MNLEEYLNRRFVPSTVKSYLREIELFRQAVPDAEQAEYHRISRYLSELRSTRNYAPTNLQRILASLKAYYDYLLEEAKVIRLHPCRSLQLRDVRRQADDPQDWFSPEELKRLLEPRPERYAGLWERNAVVIHLLLYQAVTSGELVALETGDWERNTIRLKGSHKLHARELLLEPTVQLPALEQYVREIRPRLAAHPGAKPGNALILGKLGTALTRDEIQYIVSTYADLFPGKNLNPRTIRASVIRNLLEQFDLRTIEHFSGLKTLSSVMRYQGPDPTALSQIDRFHPLQ